MDADKKEDVINLFNAIPKRKLSEIEKQMIFILIEKSKIKREKSMLITNQIFLFFMASVILTYLSKDKGFVQQLYVNIIEMFGIIVLIISIISYYRVISNEEKTLNNLFHTFLK